MDVVVVIPTYNESSTLAAVVAGVVEQGLGVLVVDDGSPDGTGALADELAQRHPAVAVLHRAAKQGLGRALTAGFEHAAARGASVVCQMDADLSHDPAELAQLVAALDRGADVAVGSRYVPGGDSEGLTPMRSLLSRFGNVYARTALGFDARDATSGFRAYRADVIPALDPGSAVAQGYAFQIEMVWRAHRAGLRIDEVPILFRARRGGASKMSLAIPLEALWLVTRWGLGRLVSSLVRRLRRP